MEIVKIVTRVSILALLIALCVVAVFNYLAPHLIGQNEFAEGIIYYTSLAFSCLSFFINLFMIPSFCINLFIALYGFIFTFNLVLVGYAFIQTCYQFVVGK